MWRRALKATACAGLNSPYGSTYPRAPGAPWRKAEAIGAAARALVHRAEGDHALGHPGRHRHRAEQHRADRSAAAAPRRIGEKAQGFDSEIGGQMDVIVVVHAVLGDTVDVRRLQPGVGDGLADRLDRQGQLAASGIPGVLGVPNPHDSRFVL
jgi:hypothetical protein